MLFPSIQNYRNSTACNLYVVIPNAKKKLKLMLEFKAKCVIKPCTRRLY